MGESLIVVHVIARISVLSEEADKTVLQAKVALASYWLQEDMGLQINTKLIAVIAVNSYQSNAWKC